MLAAEYRAAEEELASLDPRLGLAGRCCREGACQGWVRLWCRHGKGERSHGGCREVLPSAMEGSSCGEDSDSGGGRSSVGDGNGSPERGSAHGGGLEMEVLVDALVARVLETRREEDGDPG